MVCWCVESNNERSHFFFNNMLGRIAGDRGTMLPCTRRGCILCKDDCVMGPLSMEGFVGKIIFRTFYSGEGCTGVA